MFRQLNKLLILILLCVSANLFAGTPWEVSVLFLGKNEDSLFQSDVQKNIREIESIPKSVELKISVYNQSKTASDKELTSFLKKSFSKSTTSKKMLVIYSHGIGPDGLKDYSTMELKQSILDNVPHLDVLWFDACYMANLEFLFEIKKYSTYTIASEDSEFSSGLPFERLVNLTNFNEALTASKFLATEFISSYSYIKNGSQKDNVAMSSSTISVIDNSKLDNFVKLFSKVKPILNSLSAKDQLQIFNRLQNNFSMDNNELVDLGHLLIETRMKNKDKNNDLLLTELIRLLNIQSIKSLKSNPRIKITIPAENLLMVYSFSNWTRGDEADFKNNSEIYSAILKPDGFIASANGKKYPYKKVSGKSLTLSPFAPNLNTFNYLFLSADGKKIIEKENSVERTRDLVEFNRIKNDGPIVFSSYTQEIGKVAEKYTGLNILRPNAVPSMDYAELEFNSIAKWIDL
jgi:hypothetical protein